MIGADAKRRSYTTTRPWEAQAGFARAVRVGPYAETSLCSPCGADGTVMFPGDVFRQTLFCIDLIGESLEAVGLALDDVVKTRIYLADPPLWSEAGRAHGTVFSRIRPALGFVYMSGFFAAGITVEVEAVAYRPG